MLPDSIATWLGQAVAWVGGVGGSTFVLIHFFGKKWIEKQFSQSLANHQHQQTIEVQRLRVEIDSMLNGALRLQEYEFKVLPEIWDLTYEAYSKAIQLLSPFQTPRNLDEMSPEQLEECLQDAGYTASEKAGVHLSIDKSGTFFNIDFGHRMEACKAAVISLNNAVLRYGIFLGLDLKEELLNFAMEIELCLRTGDMLQKGSVIDSGIGPWQKLHNIRPALFSIEEKIAQRLRSHSEGLGKPA